MATLTALSNLAKASIANSGAAELSVLVSIDDIQLDTHFKDLFPVNEVMVSRISGSMQKKGYDKSQPLHVWKERMLLVDGHHRRLAAIKAGLREVPVFYHHFNSMEEALEYAILLQTDRRNLSDAEIYKTLQTLDSLKSRGRTTDDNEPRQQGKSAEITAQKIGISRSKVEKARTIQNKASPEIKAAVESGTMSIHAAYSDTMKQIRKKNDSTKKTPVQQWISITEQKPEENTPVLFIASSSNEQSSGYIHEGIYQHDIGQFETLHTFLTGLYWIPLSALPTKPESKGGESHV
ncbi:ParB N-terminal domain-containing protein [Treponema sp. OMZ 857]|uniref:ParB/RepB/Spo0J family partition protein n=1 Tax=Treponema sp. OMZ 857 TaxID=1643513 RepID=UPI0020A296D5|nr:ParB N-terminal domain-containing protein [Treponema sp. OMZ 857]UTC44717.1 ParB N-terminal domain-containing protein [Treponema sp. OMZ 857]